jgi:hypothetical protein
MWVVANFVFSVFLERVFDGVAIGGRPSPRFVVYQKKEIGGGYARSTLAVLGGVVEPDLERNCKFCVQGLRVRESRS